METGAVCDVAIDSHEPGSFAKYLSEQGLRVVGKSLAAGDFHFFSSVPGLKSVLVERKEVGDLLGSISDGRLFEQLKRIKDANGKPVLLVEGQISRELALRRMHPSSVLGVLASALVDFDASVIMLPSDDWSKMWFRALARQLGPVEEKKFFSLRPSAKALSPKEQALYLLEGLHRVGPKKSRQILEKYGSVKNFIDNIFNIDIPGLSIQARQVINHVITTDFSKSREAFEPQP